MAQLDEDRPAGITVALAADDGGRRVVRLAGELDLSSVGICRSGLDEFMATPPETLVIELAGLSFMDSSGIALLVEIAGAVGTFLLRDVSDVIRGVIEATGLSEILRIES